MAIIDTKLKKNLFLQFSSASKSLIIINIEARHITQHQHKNLGVKGYQTVFNNFPVKGISDFAKVFNVLEHWNHFHIWGATIAAKLHSKL